MFENTWNEYHIGNQNDDHYQDNITEEVSKEHDSSYPDERKPARREGVRRNWGESYDQNNLRRRKPKAMNFEEYASQGNRFINDVADELQTDRDTAARVTRAVIHALRDRLPPDDAMQFAQGLPMALKGVFVDQYDISKTPVVIRKADEFLDYIRYKDRFGAIRDFPTMDDAASALRAVFYVLERHLDRGQTEQIKNNLPSAIVRIIDPSW